MVNGYAIILSSTVFVLEADVISVEIRACLWVAEWWEHILCGWERRLSSWNFRWLELNLSFHRFESWK